MIRVQARNEFVPQKFYSPLPNWPWLRISWVLWMLSTIWLFLPDNDWPLCICTVFLCKLNPIKAHWGKGSWLFPFERLATFPTQAGYVLVDLFSSGADGKWGQVAVLSGQSSSTLFPQLNSNIPSVTNFCWYHSTSAGYFSNYHLSPS